MGSIKKVAIVGSGGNVGHFITEALLKTGNFKITAITREDSKSQFLDGVHIKRIDYDNKESIVEALKGQDALIITLGGMSSIQETEEKLVLAAAEVGVEWIFPNEWSPDSTHPEILKDVFVFRPKASTRKTIESIGKSNYISICTGFWYEYSLAVPKNYGFDFDKKTVQLYDDGETRICTSTWSQIGRAVAAILGSDEHLASFKNKVVYMSSFKLSQKDMLASVSRVLGISESDWTITKKTSKEMYDQGMQDMQEKNWHGTGNFLYGRLFYKDGIGAFENKDLINETLNLPGEELDEATLVAIQRQRDAANSKR